MITPLPQSNLSGDLASLINMGALAVNQLLESSQLKGVELSLETSALENQVSCFLVVYFLHYVVGDCFKLLCMLMCPWLWKQVLHIRIYQ
ncbi:hypothetical protein EON65_23475 [archaeon]|nr:MAG: hypothetical protein EON65_23475 [archaeon]